MRRALLAFVALLGCSAPSLATEPRRAAPAASVDRAAVTAENLLANERFWPYRVTLTRDWKPPGRERALSAGSAGILIRVEAGGVARIDFSSDGKFAVPVDCTDLVERANRIRRGRDEKQEPNFVWALGTRLLESDSETLRPLDPEVARARPGFLCVFADPSDDTFGAMVAALAPLRDRHGVLTIFFPQGEYSDAWMRERLRTLKWPVPFLYDFLAEPYTRTLLDVSVPPPAVLLQTNEGGVVFQSRWQPEAVSELVSRLDAAFPDTSAAPPAASGEAR